MEAKKTLPALVFLTVVGFIVAQPAVPRAEMSARDIMEKNFFVSKIKTFTSDSTMVLINDKGQTRERKMSTTSKLQQNGVDSNLLVRFRFPADVRGTGFLQIEHSDADDDIWVFLPALKKSRRLVASNKKDSFFGSDFSNGDILPPKVDLYRHTLLRTETVDGKRCHVIQSVPKDETVMRDSGYSRKITWVRQDNFLETKTEYYDTTGKLLKTGTAADHKLVEPENGRWLAMRREMVNHQTGHKTVFTFDTVDVGKPVADGVFTVRALERE